MHSEMYIIGNECRFSVRFLWHVHQYGIVLIIYDKDSVKDINERIYKMVKNQIHDIITYYLVVSFSHFIVEAQWKRVQSSIC